MKYSYLLPALLLIGFTACQRESAFDENGNGDTKDVTTQFVLSIATSAPQTKMSAANVHRAQIFWASRMPYSLRTVPVSPVGLRM